MSTHLTAAHVKLKQTGARLDGLSKVLHALLSQWVAAQSQHLQRHSRLCLPEALTTSPQMQTRRSRQPQSYMPRLPGSIKGPVLVQGAEPCRQAQVPSRTPQQPM